ncbi:unnamed protein product [Allacma fusca]|uniref:Uncharacterized protein n=1 Tax=Allacma fusca TaxID=39272 RepID=A0A8J2JAF7_9HEXA|nr:unnamed protein product [Allacma fusca]
MSARVVLLVWFYATVRLVDCDQLTKHQPQNGNGQSRHNLWSMKEPRLQVLGVSSDDEGWNYQEVIDKFVNEVQTPTKDLTKILEFRNFTITLEKSVDRMSKTNVTSELKYLADQIFPEMARINKEIRNYEIENELHYYKFLQESQSRFAYLMQKFQKKFEQVRASMEAVSNHVKDDFIILLDTQLQVEENWKNARRLGVILDQDEDYSDHDYTELINRMQWNPQREHQMVQVMVNIVTQFRNIDGLVKELANKIDLVKVENKNTVFMQEYDDVSKKNLEVIQLINENAEFLSGFKVLLDVRLVKLKDILTETTDRFSEDTSRANDLFLELNKLNEIHSRDVTNIRLRKKYIYRTEM